MCPRNASSASITPPGNGKRIRRASGTIRRPTQHGRDHRIKARGQRQPLPVDHREQGHGVWPPPGEAPAEYHAGFAAGGAQKGHGQHQRLSVTHPELRAGCDLASLTDPEEKAVPAGPIQAQARDHRARAPAHHRAWNQTILCASHRKSSHKQVRNGSFNSLFTEGSRQKGRSRGRHEPVASKGGRTPS